MQKKIFVCAKNRKSQRLISILTYDDNNREFTRVSARNSLNIYRCEKCFEQICRGERNTRFIARALLL
jgi:hypothetical protein